TFGTPRLSKSDTRKAGLKACATREIHMAGGDAIAHLLRRAGFGASADELSTFNRLSYSQAVDRLVDYDLLPDDVDTHLGQPGYVGTTSRGPFSPNTVVDDARQRWLFRMT